MPEKGEHHGEEECVFEENLAGAPVVITVEEIERLKTEMAISFSNPQCKFEGGSPPPTKKYLPHISFLSDSSIVMLIDLPQKRHKLKFALKAWLLVDQSFTGSTIEHKVRFFANPCFASR